MNANEQIKMIHSALFEIANIIKHQQAEIEALKAKTLTDGEMEIIAEALLMIGLQDYFINYDFKEKALAILRKASEK